MLAHPLDDERCYTELALRLISSTDVPARASVAERLAHYPAAPRAVVLRLARDVLDVAGPILRPSLAARDPGVRLRRHRRSRAPEASPFRSESCNTSAAKAVG